MEGNIGQVQKDRGHLVLQLQHSFRPGLTGPGLELIIYCTRDEHANHQGLKKRWSEVLDRRFVGSDLTFSNVVKTDGPVETVQLWT